MQGLGPWVESSPHWKQSKMVQSLLPYAPWATELSKDAANQSTYIIFSLKMLRNLQTSPSESQNKHGRSGSGESTNNPFY